MSAHPGDGCAGGFRGEPKEAEALFYVEETRQEHRRGGRKRALGIRKPMVLLDGPNQRPLGDCKQSSAGKRDDWISCVMHFPSWRKSSRQESSCDRAPAST